MTVELFGTDFAAEMAAAFDGELETGTLHVVSTTKDAHYQSVRTGADTAIEGTVLKWSNATLTQRGWPSTTVKILMLAHEKPAPVEGDEITMRGVRYRVVEAEDGGAEAIWNIAATAVGDVAAAPAAGIEAVVGAFVTAGQTAALLYNRILAAQTVTYATVGQSAVLRLGRRILVQTGLYVTSAQTAVLNYRRRLVAQPAVYSTAGQVAEIRFNRRLSAQTGVYVTTGFSADLSVGSDIGILALPGSYATAGQLAALRFNRVLVAQTGLYVTAGQPADLRRGLRLVAQSGSFVTAGQTAELTVGSGVTSWADDWLNDNSTSGEGFAFNFARLDSKDPSSKIDDSGTPANDHNLTLADDFDAINSVLALAAPSPKILLLANGDTGYSAQNLVDESEDFSTWSASGSPTLTAGQTDSNGGTDATRITATVNGDTKLTDVATSATSHQYRYALEAKYVAGNGWLRLSGSTGALSVWFDVQNGTVGTEGSGSSGTIVDLGDGYYLLEMVFDAALTAQPIWVEVADADNSSVADIGDSFDIAFAHYHKFPGDTQYLKTTGSPRYAAPIEYNASGEAIGIRHEDEATNLNTDSDDLTDAAYRKVTTTTAKTQTGPGGDTNGATLLTSTAANAVTLYEDADQQFGSNTTSRLHASSAYMKRVTGTGTIETTVGEGDGTTYTPTAVNNGGTNQLTSFVDNGDGFSGTKSLGGLAQIYTNNLFSSRAVGTIVKVTFNVITLDGNSMSVIFSNNTNSRGTPWNITSTGLHTAYTMVTLSSTTTDIQFAYGQAGDIEVADIVVEDIEWTDITSTLDTTWQRFSDEATDRAAIWATRIATSGDGIAVSLGQLEQDQLTSPIRTVGATVTRAADDFSKLTSEFPNNDGGAGTFYVRCKLDDAGAVQYLWEIGDGTAVDRHLVFTQSDKPRMFVETASVTEVNEEFTDSVVDDTSFAHAFAWDTNDFAHSLDGATAETDGAGALHSGDTVLHLFKRASGTTRATGLIEAIGYVPERRSNANIETVTA